MREIKFRAWNDNAKAFMSLRDHYTFWENGELLPIQSYIKLQQFTGINDKNGKEIYEGDILVCDKDGFSGEIQYEQQKAGFWLYSKSEKRYRELHMIGAYGDENGIFINAEISGNIYEPANRV